MSKGADLVKESDGGVTVERETHATKQGFEPGRRYYDEIASGVL